MKIDPNIISTTATQADRVNTQSTNRAQSQSSSTASGLSSPAGQDTVQLSNSHAQIQKLATGVANVPDVRTARVSALQQQVALGQYQPQSQAIADAILKELPGPNVKS